MEPAFSHVNKLSQNPDEWVAHLVHLRDSLAPVELNLSVHILQLLESLTQIWYIVERYQSIWLRKGDCQHA